MKEQYYVYSTTTCQGIAALCETEIEAVWWAVSLAHMARNGEVFGGNGLCTRGNRAYSILLVVDT
jgi:hypothetical protein